MSLSSSYLNLIPVRSLGYHTDVVDIAIPTGATEFVVDVRDRYNGYASEITFLNRSDAVVYFRQGPRHVEFGIPEQSAFMRTESWISWFALRAPGGIGAGSDLALTIAPQVEVDGIG